jgi:prolipoprotein diacylglyceryl transferase
VPAGVVGARLYHVMTDWRRFTDDPLKAFAIWQGGLGIWGAVALGSLGAVWVARRRGLPLGPLADACAPAIPLAQAFGRLGNWFNQELFGKPTTVWWALKIDPAHRPPGFEQYATFHPTFLYEALWCLILCGALIFVGKRWGSRLRPGSLFWLYVAGYTFVRFFIERIRIDFASRLFGLRINEWVSALVFLAAVAILVMMTVPRLSTPRRPRHSRVRLTRRRPWGCHPTKWGMCWQRSFSTMSGRSIRTAPSQCNRSTSTSTTKSSSSWSDLRAVARPPRFG